MVTISSKMVLVVSLLLTIFVVLQLKNGESFLISDKVTVFIKNNMTKYKVDVDCKDKNYDFGLRTLLPEQTYFFTFRPSSFGLDASLYFCSFSWVNGFHYFDIYVQPRDEYDCIKQCHWTVNEFGPCKVSNESSDCFQWSRNARQIGHTLNM